MLQKKSVSTRQTRCAGLGEDGEFEGGNQWNAFPRFAAERLAPFCREQRPDGRPQAVPVRRCWSLTGIDSRDTGVPQK